MRRKALLLGLISILVPLAPAAADWIRTRDGALIETEGPWKVKGSQVIFTSKAGTLSSMRVSEVDLDASAVATAEAKKPPPAPEAAEEVERQPVLELTNKDISRARAGGAEGGGTGTEGGDAEAAGDSETREDAAETPATIRVVSWRQIENTQVDGTEILGTLQNVGTDIATDLGVTVTLFNDDGTEAASVNAFLGTISLAPRTTTTLRALFPDVYSFSGEPDFAVRSQTIQVQGVIRPRADSQEE